MPDPVLKRAPTDVTTPARTMNIVRHLLLAVSLALGSTTAVIAAPDEFVRGSAEDESAVTSQLRKVVGLLDAGEHGKAWDQASKPLQDVTSRLVFITSNKAIRGVLGDVKGRTLQGIGFTRELQGAPPGRYAAVLMETDFGNATAVEERVILFDQNGQWRLAGYFVKKRRASPAGSTR